MKTLVTLHDLFVSGLDMKVYNKVHKDLDGVYVGTPAERWDRIDHVPVHELVDAYTYREEHTGRKMCKSVKETLVFNQDRFIEC